SAYQTLQSKYEAAYSDAISRSLLAPSPSINGLEEARLIADWSRRKARGERVSVEPPEMGRDGTVTVTSRTGRVDSEAGRRQAAIDAAAEEKARAAAAKQAEAARQAEAAAAAQAARTAAAAQAEAAPPAATAEAPASDEGSKGLIGG